MMAENQITLLYRILKLLYPSSTKGTNGYFLQRNVPSTSSCLSSKGPVQYSLDNDSKNEKEYKQEESWFPFHFFSFREPQQKVIFGFLSKSDMLELFLCIFYH